MQTLIPFVVFAVVASVTPGPTNSLVLSHRARDGLKATVPIIVGACIAAAGIVLAVGLGLGAGQVGSPSLRSVMSWAGILWLSVLSWQLFRSPVESIVPHAAAPTGQRFGLLGAAGLQLVNPKVWMMASAVVSVFAAPTVSSYGQVWWLSMVFLIIAVPCMVQFAGLTVESDVIREFCPWHQHVIQKLQAEQGRSISSTLDANIKSTGRWPTALDRPPLAHLDDVYQS